ncbi:Na+/H+ antiporter subunit E [Niallia circulans]|jgi:multicomponent Na+:H+ antiporter subunit E|uniref:Na+/H+ antiporter subunit E n=1 Tax=Niallia circulans TaxID=1397 RepID=A0A268FF68_NIACI|nr:Na+/H+ antiporter subunit E [Niallia circulans]AYV68576.1 Na+/H+ antiporter subunit E [Niallia circulans]AYV73031.1 Na+/H+ antiporter subunit E [Niallia circulans]PAD84025.1 Na+/H+ antiporter subunit E [Niallia circulans]UQZ75365.1 Na+/H+ antiporter subunit E [Niallia circulans]
MPMQILINLLIGIIWMFLQDTWNVLTFFTGYLFGILVLFILRRYLSTKFYLETFFAVVKLFFVFIEQLFTSSVVVIRQITRPRLNISPGIFSLETELEGELEVSLLALLMNLTPGSVVVEVTSDNKKFFIHAMDIPAQKESIFRSKEKFEKAIKRVTRYD